MTVDFDTPVINEEAAEWARTHLYNDVPGITDTTREILRSAIEAFITTPGMTYGQLVELLTPAFDEEQAEAIATTEVTRAYAMATLQQQRESAEAGILMERIWHTRNDDISQNCTICGPLNGQPESIWIDQFPYGPPGHRECRCSVALSYKGF